MLARFFKFISTNLLVAGSLAGFISFVAGTWFVAWKAPDVGSVFSGLGRWLRAPAGGTRVDEITLALVAILFGFAGCTAIFLREAQTLRRAPAAPAPAPPRAIPDEFVLTERQAWAASALMHYWPERVELQPLFTLVQQACASSGTDPHLLLKAHVARDMEQLEAVGMVRIDNLGERVRYYYLTQPGRDWLLEARELPG